MALAIFGLHRLVLREDGHLVRGRGRVVREGRGLLKAVLVLGNTYYGKTNHGDTYYGVPSQGGAGPRLGSAPLKPGQG